MRSHVIEPRNGCQHDDGHGLLRRAIRYARHGYYVYPVYRTLPDGSCGCEKLDCRKPGKHPLGELVPHGYHDATRDFDVIRGWFRRFPWANFGINLGMSGLAGVDVDPRNGGNIDAVYAQWSELAETCRILTPNGGLRLYVRLPPDVTLSPCALGPGIDGITLGIVAPGSIVNGKRYRLDPTGPTNLVMIPKKLLALWRKKNAETRTRKRRSRVPGTSIGITNINLTRIRRLTIRGDAARSFLSQVRALVGIQVDGDHIYFTAPGVPRYRVRRWRRVLKGYGVTVTGSTREDETKEPLENPAVDATDALDDALGLSRLSHVEEHTLRTGERSARWTGTDPSKSSIMHSCVIALTACGFTPKEIALALLDPAHAGGERLHAEWEARGETYLGYSLDAAARWLEDKPRLRSRVHRRRHLRLALVHARAAADMMLQEQGLTGKVRLTTLDALLALYDECGAQESWTVRFAQRSWKDAAGIAWWKTQVKTRDRLEAIGAVVQLDQGDREQGLPAQYRVPFRWIANILQKTGLPECEHNVVFSARKSPDAIFQGFRHAVDSSIGLLVATAHYRHHSVSIPAENGKNAEIQAPLLRERVQTMVGTARRGHNLFRYRVQNKSARLILDALTIRPQSTAELALRTHLAPRTVWTVMRKLEETGQARRVSEKTGRGRPITRWVLGVTTLADAEDTNERAQEARRKHQGKILRDRERHGTNVARRQERERRLAKEKGNARSGVIA